MTDESLRHELKGASEGDGEPPPPEAGRLGQGLYRAGIVFACLFLLSAAIILYEVVMRYVFDAPTTWAHETTSFLSAVGFIYGGAYCLARDRHVRVVLLYDYVRAGIRRVLDIVISITGLIAAGFLSYAAWTSVERAIFDPTGAIRLERSGSAFNPPYPALLKVFLLIMLIVIGLQFLVLAINYLRGRTRRAQDQERGRRGRAPADG